jgi:RNA polymerase sigma-70 factor (ECF subfamily)
MLASRRLVEPLAETETDRGPSPAEIAEAEERLEALTVAITRLTPEQRAPLVLREFEGLSYAEIGEVLDLTLEAVKGRLHRARLELVEAVRPWR